MVKIEHFEDSEFREWHYLMSPRLLVMLDVLRHEVGTPIIISKHKDSLGRFLGKSNKSEHNYDHWGEILAADCFLSGVYFRSQVENVVNVAKSIGFTGIGVYPEWTNNRGKPQCGFHFGVRPTRIMSNPATWGVVGGKSVSLASALSHIKTK